MQATLATRAMPATHATLPRYALGSPHNNMSIERKITEIDNFEVV